jgi:GDPmannose 4,6-dehydratase
VKLDEKFRRPSDVELLVGDYSKAKAKLGFEPKIRFRELITEMVRADYEMLKNKKS